MVRLKTVDADRTFSLTKPCPYCGGKIRVRATEWIKEDDGWVATSVEVDCDSEPDIDGNDWWAWSHSHGDVDFCEGWQRVIEGALAALKRRVRFDLDEPNENKISDAEGTARLLPKQET